MQSRTQCQHRKTSRVAGRLIDAWRQRPNWGHKRLGWRRPSVRHLHGGSAENSNAPIVQLAFSNVHNFTSGHMSTKTKTPAISWGFVQAPRPTAQDTNAGSKGGNADEPETHSLEKQRSRFWHKIICVWCIICIPMAVVDMAVDKHPRAILKARMFCSWSYWSTWLCNKRLLSKHWPGHKDAWIHWQIVQSCIRSLSLWGFPAHSCTKAHRQTTCLVVQLKTKQLTTVVVWICAFSCCLQLWSRNHELRITKIQMITSKHCL